MTAPRADAPVRAGAPLALLSAYGAVALLNVGGHVIDAGAITRLTTAVAVPLLLLWLLATARRPLARPLRAMAVGLVFAWFGDLLLMGEGDLRFALGIASFAVMQVCYIVAFRRVPGPGMVRAWKIAAVPYLVVWLVLAVLMLRGGDPLAVAGVVYGLLLVAMAISALDLVLRVPRSPGWRVAWGAALFVVSDGLIALTAFAGVERTALTSTLIMATYLAAQAMIVTGFTEALAERPTA